MYPLAPAVRVADAGAAVTPGMLSGTACGLLLLLLLGGLAVALAMNAFLRLALLALGTVPLLVTLLATNKTLVVLVPTVPLCFHSSGLFTCLLYTSPSPRD